MKCSITKNDVWVFAEGILAIRRNSTRAELCHKRQIARPSHRELFLSFSLSVWLPSPRDSIKTKQLIGRPLGINVVVNDFVIPQKLETQVRGFNCFWRGDWIILNFSLAFVYVPPPPPTSCVAVQRRSCEFSCSQIPVSHKIPPVV